MSKEHHYTQTIIWTGNKGVGRIGDQYSNNIITQGSSSVFAG